MATKSAALRAHWACAAKVCLRPAANEKPKLYRTLRARVVTHWALLQRETWDPLLAAAERDVGRSGWASYGDWRRVVPALVLECAVNWALEGNTSTTQARESAARAALLESEIAATAQRLAELIDERRKITREHGLSTEWGGPNLDLWDLLDRAAREYPGWAFVCAHEREAFLRLAQEQTRPGPELEDVLRGVQRVHPSIIAAVRSGDDASLALKPGSALSGRAARVRRYLDKLKRIGGRVGPLQWLGPTSVAVLLSVLEGHDATNGPFNAKATGKTRARYLKELAASTDKLAT